MKCRYECKEKVMFRVILWPLHRERSKTCEESLHKKNGAKKLIQAFTSLPLKGHRKLTYSADSYAQYQVPTLSNKLSTKKVQRALNTVVVWFNDILVVSCHKSISVRAPLYKHSYIASSVESFAGTRISLASLYIGWTAFSENSFGYSIESTFWELSIYFVTSGKLQHHFSTLTWLRPTVSPKITLHKGEP